MKSRYIVFAATGLLLLTSYNNCGRSFSPPTATFGTASSGSNFLSEDENGNDPGGGTASPDTVATLHKSNTQIIPQASNPNTWTRIEWDLSYDVADPNQVNMYPLVAGIEIRAASINSAQRGYEFRNPTLRLKTAGTPYTAKGLKLS